jgi:hypothetical protein
MTIQPTACDRSLSRLQGVELFCQVTAQLRHVGRREMAICVVRQSQSPRQLFGHEAVWAGQLTV